MNIIDSDDSEDVFSSPSRERPNWVKNKEARYLASLKSNEDFPAVITQMSQDCSPTSASTSSYSSSSTSVMTPVARKPFSYLLKKKKASPKQKTATNSTRSSCLLSRLTKGTKMSGDFKFKNKFFVKVGFDIFNLMIFLFFT